jgi:acyl dehydratase
MAGGEIDTSEIDRWVGVPLTRTGIKEPVAISDIRRWVTAMHHPNRLHFDEEYAAGSRFGGIIAPQSFTVNVAAGHGARGATQGFIPESHMLFAGDEWWFFGPRIRPGDKFVVDQSVFDYRKTTSSFAGPMVIQRGDSNYVNQAGERVALQRASAFRYQPQAARETAAYEGVGEEPEWSDDELELLVKDKELYVRSIIELGHDPRPFEGVGVGDELPVKVLGPHSVVSFATEWRAYTMNAWGATFVDQLVDPGDGGWTKEMSVDPERVKWDPEFGDGAYYGAARGHLNAKYARRIGMPRPYGYGASMGAWVIDHLSTWAGEWGYVAHTSTQYRGPAFTGDVSYLRGSVTAKSDSMDPSMGQVHIDYTMVNQRDELLAKGTGEVLLPRS